MPSNDVIGKHVSIDDTSAGSDLTDDTDNVPAGLCCFGLKALVNLFFECVSVNTDNDKEALKL